MNTLEKLTILRSCVPFDKLSPAELAQVADSCDEKKFLPGQTVFQKEANIMQVHVIVSGELLCGQRSLSGIVGAEGVLLHSALREPLLAGQEGAITLMIGRGRFYTIINECPAFTCELAKQFAKTRDLYTKLEAD